MKHRGDEPVFEVEESRVCVDKVVFVARSYVNFKSYFVIREDFASKIDVDPRIIRRYDGRPFPIEIKE